MAKIIWDAAGTHRFETGVSKGVLYVKNDDGTYANGVAWNGLSSVSESPEGAEPNAIYADNQKYLNLLSVEEFKASIEAYTYPDEFEECDGSKALSSTAGHGVFVSQQSRKQFALCYQTKVGNDSNPEAGYKIHIIYGCYAAPTERSHETVNDSPEAMTMSWEITTTPIEVTASGFKPVSHLVIDSTKFTSATAAKLALIEDALYGTNGSGSTGTEPTLKTPDEILAILQAV